VLADGWLGTQLDKLSRHNAGPIDLSSDYRTDLNRVQLDVAGHDLAAGERALVASAKARYGDMIQMVAQPAGSSVGVPLDCTHPYCYPPLRGGINITNPGSASSLYFGASCTGSFIAASRTDGKLYEFTAGHCAGEGLYSWTGTWYTKFPDGSTHAVGPVSNYVYGNSGDEAILTINNPNGWMLPQGWVYVTAGSSGTTLNERYPITSAQYSTLNQRICTTGAASGSTTCGVVTALGVNHQFCATLPTASCTTVNNLGQTNMCQTEGDSGAPLYAGNQAFGLLSGQWDAHTPCTTLYQGIISAENAMNVNIVLANNRPSPWPTGLQAVGVQGGVKLTWQDNSNNETAWIINDGTTNRYLTVSNGSTTGPVSYTWTGLGSHQYQCFRVAAYNAWGASGYTPSSGSVCAYSAT
jgi:hypothetical protein